MFNPQDVAVTQNHIESTASRALTGREIYHDAVSYKSKEVSKVRRGTCSVRHKDSVFTLVLVDRLLMMMKQGTVTSPKSLS